MYLGPASARGRKVQGEKTGRETAERKKLCWFYDNQILADDCINGCCKSSQIHFAAGEFSKERLITVLSGC